MNFAGLHHYTPFTNYSGSSIPKFSFGKKEYQYKPEDFTSYLYQMNISSILQWIEYINLHSSFSISNDIYHLNFIEKEEEQLYLPEHNKKGELVIIQRFGNTNLLFTKKICKNCNDTFSPLNEFYIGLYGLNFLRLKLPTFSYTYCLHRTNKYISIKSEYIHGEKMNTFLQQCSFGDFYAILLQILISLEIAQQDLLFTHYDLNFGNILIEKIEKPFSLFLGKKKYTFRDYRIRIIDFGFSCMSFSKDTIFSSCFFKAGYKKGFFPFFTPGTDMFRILCEFLYLVKKDSLDITKKNFLFSLFKNFYHISPENLFENLYKYRFSFFNCSVFPFIYNIPLDIIDFLEKNQETIQTSFLPHPTPFQIEEKTQKTSPLLFEKEFLNIFSIQEMNKQINTDNSLQIIYSKSVDSSMDSFKIPKKIPHFLLEPIDKIERFYNNFSFFIDNFSIQRANTEQHRFLRTLFTIKCFLSFIKTPQFSYHEKIHSDMKNIHDELKIFL